MTAPRTHTRPALRSGLLLLLVLVPGACSSRQTTHQPAGQGDTSTRSAELGNEIERLMHAQLELWYRLVMDSTHGGFLSTFTYDWKPEEPQDKMIVTQARHVWTASKAAEWFPDDPRYLATARHGFAFLRDHMWDETHGGFYDRGYYFEDDGPPVILHDAKVWWAQAEALNALLLFADLYPQDTLRYFDRAEVLWTYIQNNLIDAEHGGWYEGGLDREPQMRTARKAHIWKGN